MLIYVAFNYGGKKSNIRKAAKITHDLQLADPENTYICPLLAFSHLKYNELGYEEEMHLCMDLLSECMSMVVASKISKGVQMEIEYCKLWNMPIKYLNVEKPIKGFVALKEWFKWLSR
jgi:hypothetical protein